MKKPRNQTTPPAAPPGPKLIKITHAGELEQLIRKPMSVLFSIDGEVAIELPVRRLTPKEEAAITGIRTELGLPPYDPEKKEFLYQNPGYMKKRDLLEAQIRSLRIWTACDAVRAARPDLNEANRDAIHEYVSNLWTEPVLELVNAHVQAAGVGLLEKLVNFTSTAG